MSILGHKLLAPFYTGCRRLTAHLSKAGDEPMDDVYDVFTRIFTILILGCSALLAICPTTRFQLGNHKNASVDALLPR